MGVVTSADSCGVYGDFLKCTQIKQINREGDYPVTVSECIPDLSKASDKCKKVCYKVIVSDIHPMATSNYCVDWVKREDISLANFKWNVTKEK